MIKVRRGLDIPLRGVPAQVVESAPVVRRVALLGQDAIGMRPTMEVRVGDRVKAGQLLYTDKKTPGVGFTAPGCGTVTAIHRGDKRAFLSIEIALEGEDAVRFEDYAPERLPSLSRQAVEEQLVASGLWTALRTRPYSKVPRPGTTPTALFVTAIDTQPCAVDPAVVLAEYRQDFLHGLQVLRHLTDGPLYLCAAPKLELPAVEGVRRQDFAGPHPAGLAGTHIHLLHPVDARRTVWTIGYQDVVSVGKLFTTGHLWLERIVALGGPAVKRPRLLRTPLGACVSDLCREQLQGEGLRRISGSVLYGHTAAGALDFLGRYHLQVTALAEGGERVMFGWTLPGARRFSINRTFLSRYLPKTHYPLTTEVGGSLRAIVPIASYEKILPLDLEPVYLLRALAADDSDLAQQLGCLELDEEDLALCTFVCCGKNDYGRHLRQILTRIEKEG